MLSKNVNNKKCAPKLIFFNEKKIEKDSDNFWYRKLTLKVKRLGDFALFDTSPLTQFSKFNNFLWVCWFLGKNLSNFVPPVWKLHNPHCNTVYEGEIWCLCTVTFGQKGSKLNSKPVYCSRLYYFWNIMLCRLLNVICTVKNFN